MAAACGRAWLTTVSRIALNASNSPARPQHGSAGPGGRLRAAWPLRLLCILAAAICLGAEASAQTFTGTQTTNGPFSSGDQYFYDTSTFDANAAYAAVGGRQFFNNSSSLNASAGNAIRGGLQVFYASSSLNASAANAVNGGNQQFTGFTILNATVADAVSGGAQTFVNSSWLNATAGNAVSGGHQIFWATSQLNASATNAVSGGIQDFYNNSVLNSYVSNAVSGGVQTFNDASVLNAVTVNAVSGGTQNFDNASALNASGSSAITGGTQTFSGASALNASNFNAVNGGSQTFHDTSALNASQATAVSGGTQSFYDTSTLNASTANAVSDGSQLFYGTSSLNASAANAVAGGTQTFFNSSALKASVANALSGGTQLFYGTSVLTASAANAVSGGTQTFSDTSALNASVGNALSGGTQSFYGSSMLNASAANAVSGGVQGFNDSSALNASVANAVSGGGQGFLGSSALNASAANAVSGGFQIFYNSSTLNATVGNAVSGGDQRFQGDSRLNASAANAVSGGAQDFFNSSRLDASAANAVSGGAQFFRGTTTLNASAANAVSGGTQSFYQASKLNVLADNALTRDVGIDFYSTIGGPGGTLRLNGHSSVVGAIDSQNGGAGIVENGAATNSILTVDSSTAGASSFSGVIRDGGTGSLALVKEGAGILTLSGANTYTGPTTVNGGELRINSSIAGAATVNAGGTLSGAGSIASLLVTSGGTISGAAGSTLTMSSLALDAGSNVDVALGAPSTTALFNVTGNLTLAGTLNVTDAGGFGAGIYRLFDYGGSLTDNGLAIGSTPAGVTASNLFVQTSVANQINLVSTQGVELSFWDGGNSALHDNGAVDGGSGIWRADGRNWTQADGAVNGPYQPNPTFAVFQNAGGVVTVDASAGAIGVTKMQFAVDGYRIEGDSVALQGSGGSTTIRVGDGTAAGAGMTATIASALTGNSRLVKSDLGTLVLTGTNSYSGGTTISAGTLRGSAAGFGSGAILDNAALVVDQQTDAVFANVIDGSGSFTKTGAGALTLTGISGLIGPTTIGAGALAVDGSLANSTVTIAAGAALRGGGTVGGIVAQSGGTIAPGSGGIGTLSVEGNLSMSAGSHLAADIDGTGASDRIAVSGTADITGAALDVSAQGLKIGRYTIMTTGSGLTGSFGSVTGIGAISTFLGVTDSYDTYNAYLDVLQLRDLADAGATRNQKAAAAGIQSLAGSDPFFTGNPLYNAILALPTDAAARNAFGLVSGEAHASAKTALIEDGRFIQDAATDRIRAAFGAVGAPQAPVLAFAEPADGRPGTADAALASLDQETTAGIAAPATTDRFALWGQGFGGWGNTGGDGNAARLSHSTGGVLVGIDAPAFDTWRFGMMAGYSRTSFEVKDHASSGASDNYHLGVYGGTDWNVLGGDLGFRTGASYSWHEISTGRSVVLPGFSDSLKAEYHAGTAQVFGELGYGIRAGGLGFEPFANLAYVNLRSGAFAEQGGAAALQGAGSNSAVSFTTLGLHASTDVALGDTAATVRGTLGWRHAFGDTTPLSTLALAGGSPFTVAGVPIARNALVLDVGVDVAIARNATLGISYGGQFAGSAIDQSVKGNLAVRF